jgi:hypothetical protein
MTCFNYSTDIKLDGMRKMTKILCCPIEHTFRLRTEHKLEMLLFVRCLYRPLRPSVDY